MARSAGTTTSRSRVKVEPKEPLSKGIGQRIEQVRGRLTQNAFAKSVGISKSTLIRYEREDRLPDAEVIARVCETYNADFTWLITGKGNPFVPEPEEKECVQIPKFDIGVSAGPGAFVEAAGEPELISVDLQWLRQDLHVCPAEVSMIYVRGDSMQPTIMDGDMLLVSSRVEPIRDGIYVSRYDGLLQVKRLQRQPKGGGSSDFG
ncbi:MAG: helix-turn-helix domain-containing protein [Leptolyngbyaceae cyanobacterium SU_3_3]|nr:helix-turn-helix domain-containing protein [Leptolyngbyaceae cyanobacterium SU_3_3]